MELEDKKLIDAVSFLDKRVQRFIAAIGQSLSGQENVDAVLSQVAEFLGAGAASIFLVDEPTGDLVLCYATGEVGDKIVGLRLPSGQGVVGWVVKYSEDLIVPYPGLDTRFFEGVDESTGFFTQSILCSPIKRSEKAIGAVEMLNKREGTFNDDDLVLLRAVADQLVQVFAVAP